jgi:TolA-binding protein
MLLCAVIDRAEGASRIKNIRIGTHETFSRLVFHLDNPTSYVISQDGDMLWVKFYPATVSSSISYQRLHDSTIKKVSLVSVVNDRVEIAVFLNRPGLKYHHFLSGKQKVVLDIHSKGSHEKSEIRQDIRLSTGQAIKETNIPNYRTIIQAGILSQIRHDEHNATEIPRRQGRVVGFHVNIRTKPGTRSSVIKQVNDGEVLEIQSYDDDWYQISVDQARSGYIFKDYLQPMEIHAPPCESVGVQHLQSPNQDPKKTDLTTEAVKHIDKQCQDLEPPHVPEIKQAVNLQAQRLLRSGTRALRGHNYEVALLNFQELIDGFPESDLRERALFLIGDCYFHMGVPEHAQLALKAYQRAINTYPKSEEVPRAYLYMALIYSEMEGYLSEAIAYFDLIGRDYPESRYAPSSYFHKGKIFYEKEAFKEAQKELRHILDAYPQSQEVAKATMFLAKCLFKMGWHKQSEEAFTNLENIWPAFYTKDPEALYCMGENYFQLKNYKKARLYLFRTLNVYPRIKENHVILTRIGDCYYHEGRKSEAIKLYNLTRRLHPESEMSLVARMRLLENNILSSGDRTKDMFSEVKTIVASYKDIIKSYPDSPLAELAMFKIATISYDKHNYTACISTLREMMLKYPKTKLMENIVYTLQEALLKQIKLYLSDKRYVAMADYYQSNVELFTKVKKAECFLYIGNGFQKLGLYDQAVKLYSGANNLLWEEDKRDEWLFSFGKACFRMGLYDQAIHRLQELSDSYPQSTYNNEDAQLLMGKAFCQLGKHTEAVRTLKHALERFPLSKRRGETLFFLGGSLEALGKFSSAARAFSEAAELYQPSLAYDRMGAYYRLGGVLLKDGNYHLAIQTYNRALEIDRQDERASYIFYNMGKCYLALGKEKEARRIFKQVLAMPHDNLEKRMSSTMLTQMELDRKISQLSTAIEVQPR